MCVKFVTLNDLWFCTTGDELNNRCIWPPEGSRVNLLHGASLHGAERAHVSVLHHDGQSSSHYSVFWILEHHCQHLQLPKKDIWLLSLISSSANTDSLGDQLGSHTKPKALLCDDLATRHKISYVSQVVTFCCFKCVCQWEEIQNVIIVFQSDLTLVG